MCKTRVLPPPESRPESEDVGQEEGESPVVVEPPDVDEPGVGLVGEHLDAGHVLRRDEVAVVPAEHGDLQGGSEDINMRDDGGGWVRPCD